MATDTTLEELVINDYTGESAVIPETLPADELSLTPDTSLEKVVHDATLVGDGTAESPLKVVGGSGGGGLESVAHNTTLTGDGTSASPLGVSDSVALKTDIPDVSNFATKSEIPDTSNLLSSVSHNSSLTGNGTSASPLGIGDTVALKTDIPDVSGFATKSEIPDTSNLLSSVAHDTSFSGDGTSASPLALSTTVQNQLSQISILSSNIDSLYEEVGEKLDATTAASTYATNTDAVHKTGVETIAGAKTFTDDLTVKGNTKNIHFHDNNDGIYGILSASHNGDDDNYTNTVSFGVTGGNDSLAVGISIKETHSDPLGDGGKTSYQIMGRTPSSNSNNTEIATTAWCQGHGILVASQMPSEANNYTWYRKYSDGWIEQGGRVGGHATTSITVTFPTPFINNAYTVAVTRVASSSVTNGTVVLLFDQFTSTSFQYVYTGGSGGSQWMACGY